MNVSLHWSAMSEWSSIWGMRLLLKIYLLCGRKVLQWFLYPVVSYYWVLNKTGRNASRDYLKRIALLAPETGITGSWGDSYRHFLSFANAITDKLAAWSGAISPSEVDYCGRDELMAVLKQGRGVLLLGSHLGNLEVCRVLADFDDTLRLTVLVHTKHAEKFNRLLKDANPRSNMNLLQVTEINAATAGLLSDKIEQGELVVIAADRIPVAANARIGRVNFLGYDALLPQGPFILASLLKCPVFTLFCFNCGNRYSVIFEFFSQPLNIARKNREETLATLMQDYALLLQKYCLSEPLQWFNFYDFWRIDGSVR